MKFKSYTVCTSENSLRRFRLTNGGESLLKPVQIGWCPEFTTGSYDCFSRHSAPLGPAVRSVGTTSQHTHTKIHSIQVQKRCGLCKCCVLKKITAMPYLIIICFVDKCMGNDPQMTPPVVVDCFPKNRNTTCNQPHVPRERCRTLDNEELWFTWTLNQHGCWHKLQSAKTLNRTSTETAVVGMCAYCGM